MLHLQKTNTDDHPAPKPQPSGFKSFAYSTAAQGLNYEAIAELSVEIDRLNWQLYASEKEVSRLHSELAAALKLNRPKAKNGGLLDTKSFYSIIGVVVVVLLAMTFLIVKQHD